MKIGLLFDPFAVVVEVVVVIFYASRSSEKSLGKIDRFPTHVRPHYFGANEDENERTSRCVLQI